MAEKKSNSRALKAVNDTKKKTGNPTTSVKKKEIEDKSKHAVSGTFNFVHYDFNKQKTII